MSSVEGIPGYVLQNLASIKSNLSDMMANTVRVGDPNSADFDNFLNSAFDDITSTFSEGSFDSAFGVIYSDRPYRNSAPGTASNGASEGMVPQNILNQNMMASRPQLPNSEAEASVKKAYDSLLNGEMAKQLAPSVSSLDKNSVLEKLKRINAPDSLNKNTSLITDEEFFDAETLTPQKITDILKKKGSPYAYQVFDGKTVGQLIYDECHKAGNIDKGTHTLNPALVLAVMGAESGFGTDSKAVPNNPFNIRLNGSFNNVNSFQTSLNMSVNTLYNWAHERPSSSKVSLLDYAGDKYCENYTEKWKPNVEKYFLEFTVGGSETLKAAEEAHKQKLVSDMLSSLGSSSANNGLNVPSMLKFATNKENADKMIDSLDSASTLNVLSSFDKPE